MFRAGQNFLEFSGLEIEIRRDLLVLGPHHRGLKLNRAWGWDGWDWDSPEPPCDPAPAMRVAHPRGTGRRC